MKLIYSRDSNKNKSLPILFLTHKEYLSITGEIKWKKIRKLIFFHEFLKLKIFSFLNQLLIKAFNNKSIINSIKIVHWGVTLNEPIPHIKEYSDVHLLDKKSSQKANKIYGFPLTLSMTSKDFEPENSFIEFYEDSFKWDLITVSHNSRRKCLDDCLYIIRKVLDKKPDLKSLLIINTPSKSYRKNTFSSSVNFLKIYDELFNYKERQQIVLLRISDEMGLEGVSPSFIKWSMFNSKIFLFASKKEGSAKVLTEAQNSNCIILARKGLKGGSYDNLKKSIFFTWSKPDEASSKILKILKKTNSINIRNRNRNRNRYRYINISSIKKLEKFLKERNLIPNDHNLYRGDFEFANRWLPAHLEVRKSRGVTSDIDNPIKLWNYLRSLKN